MAVFIFKRASFEQRFVNIITNVHKRFLHPASVIFLYYSYIRNRTDCISASCRINLQLYKKTHIIFLRSENISYICQPKTNNYFLLSETLLYEEQPAEVLKLPIIQQEQSLPLEVTKTMHLLMERKKHWPIIQINGCILLLQLI